MVKDGKITRKQLDLVQRLESAHANSVEHFTFLVAAWVSFPLPSPFPPPKKTFHQTPRKKKKNKRTLFWWTGNVACMALVVMSGRKMNEGVGFVNGVRGWEGER